MVQSQTEQTKDFLESVTNDIGNFLNATTLNSLLKEEPEGNNDYFKGLLSSLRRLYVFCEEGLDASKVILNGDKFRKGAAEKTLYWIYHQCVQEFYSPKNENWYEDSRSAYTGKNAIKYFQTTPESVKQLMASLEKGFQEIREELEYYETDYKTKMLQSK